MINIAAQKTVNTIHGLQRLTLWSHGGFEVQKVTCTKLQLWYQQTESYRMFCPTNRSVNLCYVISNKTG